ncbi:MAG: hypothetical protein RL434_1805 [Pseudomonadota bacterium]
MSNEKRMLGTAHKYESLEYPSVVDAARVHTDLRA